MDIQDLTLVKFLLLTYQTFRVEGLGYKTIDCKYENFISK